jgi:predicted AlkP superfamily phosphohydrolase/phosphomutase
MADDQRRALVLGLDGASFDILFPLMERNLLPNLTRMMKEGVWGVLESTIPPYTAQAWVAMATGNNQGKHGVVDFWKTPTRRAEGGLADSTLIRSETLWSILGRHGRNVGIVNVPVTYPPAAVNGYMVSGLMTPPGRSDYTYPPELRHQILDAVGEYEPDPYDPVSPSQGLLEQYLHWVRKKEEANQFLMKEYPWDFFMNVVQALDQIQHFFWSCLDDSHPRHSSRWASEYVPMIEECYTVVDSIIGQRLSLLDERTNLFVVSDHGFGPAHTWFQVNKFLSELGLFVLEESLQGALTRAAAAIGLTPRRTKDVFLRIDPLRFSQRWGRWTRIAWGRRLDAALSGQVSWTRTKAYAGSPSTEGVYINLKGRDERGIVGSGDEYAELRDFIVAELSELKDPESGAAVIEAVYRKEEIYEGECVSLLPDIVFSMSPGYLPRDDTSASEILQPIPSRGYVEGRHRPDGIFLAIGPDICEREISGARIVDVAPTILYSMGLPIPSDVDGRVLLEVFCPLYRDSHTIEYEDLAGGLGGGESATPYSAEELADIQRKLSGLGYLS